MPTSTRIIAATIGAVAGFAGSLLVFYTDLHAAISIPISCALVWFAVYGSSKLKVGRGK